MTSEGAVSAAINWINRLIEDHEQSQARFRELTEERDQLLRWKNEALVMQNVGEWLQECDYLKRKLSELKKLMIP
jgi:hypothetical protein